MKRIIALVVSLIMLASICGCDERRPVKISEMQLILSGETSALGYIYYSDGNSVRRVKEDGTGDEAFTDFYSTFWFVYDGWVYYTDRENHPEFPNTYKTAPILHRRREDGTNDQCVGSTPAKLITCHDGYIYYIPYYVSSEYDYGDGLYRIDPDGSNEVTLYPDGVNGYYFDGGYIYYEIAGSDVKRMDMDGKHKTNIFYAHEYSGMGILSDLAFDSEYIYYTADLPGDYLNNTYLYRVKKDGAKKMLITQICTKDFVLMNDTIYFTGGRTSISDLYLYKMKPDGSEVETVSKKLVSSDAYYLQADDQHVYVHLIDDYSYDPVGGLFERSSLYRILG